MHSAKALYIKGLTDRTFPHPSDRTFNEPEKDVSSICDPIQSTDTDVQYQSAQCSAQSTPNPLPMIECQEQDGSGSEGNANYNFGDDSNPMNDFNATLFDQWNGEYEMGSDIDQVETMKTASKCAYRAKPSKGN